MWREASRMLMVFAVFSVWGCLGGDSGISSAPDKGRDGAKDTVGLFFKPNNRVTLALDDQHVPGERHFNFGKRNPAWDPRFTPVAGDFSGRGGDTVGMYVRRQSRFILHTKNEPGWPRFDFEFCPVPGAAQDLSVPLHPVIGDWDGDGLDTVGLYRSDTGEFFLRNENAEGPADVTLMFGTANSIPLAGDWDGDGVDSVGVYSPLTGRLELAVQNKTGTASRTSEWEAGQALPLAGDWDGDGTDTIGFYDEPANLFHLGNSLTRAAGDRTVQIGGSRPYPSFPVPASTGAAPLRFPIAGHWDTTGDPDADSPHAWGTAVPASQSIDPVKLAEAYRHAGTLPHLHSLLVIRNGRLVAEEYFNGFAADTPNCIKSCTKVFTSALVGIAIEQGFLTSVDQPIKDFLPECITAESHPWKQEITIHHLLNMRSGIAWENETWNPQMTPSSNWVKFYLDRQMAAQPGETFQYASGCPHTIAAILRHRVGEPVDKYAEKVLFGPLGIKATRWDYEPNEGQLTFGPCEIFMQPRDMARLGELYVRGGCVEGRQIVPKTWVEYSQTNHGNNYGNFWWHHREKGYFSFAALGYGGQFIFVTPELNLVVVTTSRWHVNSSTAKSQKNMNFDLWSNYILPAVN